MAAATPLAYREPPELAEAVEQIRAIALAGGIREELVPRERLRAMLADCSLEELRSAPAQYEKSLEALKAAAIDPNDPHDDDIVFSGSADEARCTGPRSGRRIVPRSGRERRR